MKLLNGTAQYQKHTVCTEWKQCSMDYDPFERSDEHSITVI